MRPLVLVFVRGSSPIEHKILKAVGVARIGRSCHGDVGP